MMPPKEQPEIFLFLFQVRFGVNKNLFLRPYMFTHMMKFPSLILVPSSPFLVRIFFFFPHPPLVEIENINAFY